MVALYCGNHKEQTNTLHEQSTKAAGQ